MKKNQKNIQISEIPLRDIVFSNDLKRVSYDKESLAELANSIGKKGLLQFPAVKSLENGKYELIFGGRRIKAFELLQRATIPCVVISAETTTLLTLFENIQRVDLNLFEEASLLKRAIEEENLTQRRFAELYKKNEGWVSKRLKFYEAVQPYKDKLAFTKLPKSVYLELLETPELFEQAEREEWGEKEARQHAKEYKDKKESGQVSTKKERKLSAESHIACFTKDGFIIRGYRFKSGMDIEEAIKRIGMLSLTLQKIWKYLLEQKGQQSGEADMLLTKIAGVLARSESQSEEK